LVFRGALKRYLDLYTDFISRFHKKIPEVVKLLEETAQSLIGARLITPNNESFTISMVEIYADGIWDESGDYIKEMFEYKNKELQVIDDNFRPLIVSALYNSDRRVNRMRPSLLKLNKDNFGEGRYDGMVLRNNAVYLQQKDIWTQREIVPVYAQLVEHSLTQTNTNYYKGYFDMIISFLEVNKNSPTISIKYNDIRTVDELSEIKEYKVSPLGGF